MDVYLNQNLFIGSIVLLLSILLSKPSARFGLPILVLFMMVGVVIGIKRIGGVGYENYNVTQMISSIALCFIVFSGGLQTKFEKFNYSARTGLILSSFGVILSTALIGGICHYFFDIQLFESLLIGAILSSTDVAAVFTALRDPNSEMSAPVQTTLEIESGSNDSMAFLMVSIFLDLYTQQESSFQNIAIYFFTNPIIGFLGGMAFYKAFEFINNKIDLDHKGLYPALTIGFVFLTFSSVTFLGGNGFLALYIMGLKIGNTKLIHKHSLVDFFDGTSWIFQIGLFILMGVLVSPTRLLNVAFTGTILAISSIFVARLLSVLVCSFKSGFDFKEKLLISWAGLKGATPVIFACLVATRVGTEANFIFDLVFFTVLISALLQGFSLNFVAKKLGLLFEKEEDENVESNILSFYSEKKGHFELQIKEHYFALNQRLVDLNLPQGVIVLSIKREGSYMVPTGNFVFEEGDAVMVLTPNRSDRIEVYNYFRNQRIQETAI